MRNFQDVIFFEHEHIWRFSNLHQCTFNDQIIKAPVSNAKLEIIFSKSKRVKTNFSCSLVVELLENILRIMVEGSSWEISK